MGSIYSEALEESKVILWRQFSLDLVSQHSSASRRYSLGREFIFVSLHKWSGNYLPPSPEAISSYLHLFQGMSICFATILLVHLPAGWPGARIQSMKCDVYLPSSVVARKRRLNYNSFPLSIFSIITTTPTHPATTTSIEQLNCLCH